ncbi:MAG: polyphosphate polymerase domain-containing protein [Clostridia bacterium]|nr:polyphosphate polymerase domain-containing protein [Clostridia bacterium]
MLEAKLSAVLCTDSHAEGGAYTIRSLYFDDYHNRALFEKLDGTDPREKFRIRIYNRRDDYICVEKKVKKGELTQKLQTRITRDRCDAVLRGDIDWMWREGDGLLAELYTKMREGLVPKTIVEYDRIPYVYAPGNVRVTLDCAIRSGTASTDLFGDIPLVPVMPLDVLEVKFDAYLPDIIRMLTAGIDSRRTAVSKYAMCRKTI